MTGGERLAKVAEVLAGHRLGGDTAQANSAAGLCACGTRFYENGESPASALAAWRRLERAHAAHVAQALAPLLDTFRAEDEARALREAAEEIGSSVSYGFGMRHDGTEDSQAMAYVEGLRDAWQIVNNRADRIGGDA